MLIDNKVGLWDSPTACGSDAWLVTSLTPLALGTANQQFRNHVNKFPKRYMNFLMRMAKFLLFQ